MNMKSKKFSAAEKHFQKKEEKLRSELHRARIAERNALAEANKILQIAADISKENLQLLIRNSKAIEQWTQLHNFMARY